MTSLGWGGALLAAGGLTDFSVTLFLSTLVLFGLFALLLGKFGWGPLLAVIEEREKTVQEGVDGAHRAKTEAEALLAEQRELLRAAARERDEIVKRAVAEAEEARAALSARAKAEGEAMIRDAREAIEREKARVILELRAEAVDLAVSAAAKIVASSLTPEAQRHLAQEFITALPQAK